MISEHTLVSRGIVLVRQIARSIARRARVHIEEDDLVDAGTQGMLTTLELFDPARGVPYELFAKHRIRGAILDSFRTRSECRRAFLVGDGCLLFQGCPETSSGAVMRREVNELVDRLPDRYRYVIRAYYGTGLPMLEIGRVLGVTVGRISQMRREALAKMRRLIVECPGMAKSCTPHFNDMIAARGGRGASAKAPKTAPPVASKLPPPPAK